MDLLEKKRKQLQILEEQLEDLQNRFSVACTEKEKLEAEQLDCSIKLERAEKLISMMLSLCISLSVSKKNEKNGYVLLGQHYPYQLNIINCTCRL